MSIQTFSQGVERYFLFMDMIPPIAVHIFAQNLSVSLFNIAHAVSFCYVSPPHFFYIKMYMESKWVLQ